MRTIGVLEGSREFAAEQAGLRVSSGPFTLTRATDGTWFLGGRTASLTIEDLRQLGEIIKLIAVHEIPTAGDLEVEGGVSAAVIDDARDLLQRHAETNGGEDAQFGGPDVEFGVGPAEEGPFYSMHVLMYEKLKELSQSDVLALPIKMLKIGDEYVPDKTFSGTAITAEWHQHVWPVWRLHEDGFIVLAPDGKTAAITMRGGICRKQIEDHPNLVYGEDDRRSAQPPRADDSELDLVDDGHGGTVPQTWAMATRDVRQVIAANGDPQVIADGLCAVAATLKLGTEYEILDLLDYACSGYERVDEVEDAIQKYIEAAKAAQAAPPI